MVGRSQSASIEFSLAIVSFYPYKDRTKVKFLNTIEDHQYSSSYNKYSYHLLGVKKLNLRPLKLQQPD